MGCLMSTDNELIGLPISDISNEIFRQTSISESKHYSSSTSDRYSIVSELKHQTTFRVSYFSSQLQYSLCHGLESVETPLFCGKISGQLWCFRIPSCFWNLSQFPPSACIEIGRVLELPIPAFIFSSDITEGRWVLGFHSGTKVSQCPLCFFSLPVDSSIFCEQFAQLTAKNPSRPLSVKPSSEPGFKLLESVSCTGKAHQTAENNLFVRFVARYQSDALERVVESTLRNFSARSSQGKPEQA